MASSDNAIPDRDGLPDTEFWTWSLTAYDRPGAAPSLLRLQDEAGLNVNVILWCLWCAEKYREPEEALLRTAIDLTNRWSAPIAAHLRAARKLLKSPPPQANPANAETVRDGIKKAELDAEKLEQDILQALAQNHLECSPEQDTQEGYTPPAHAKRHANARRALASYAALMGAAQSKSFSISLLDNAITAIFGQEDKADAAPS